MVSHGALTPMSFSSLSSCPSLVFEEEEEITSNVYSDIHSFQSCSLQRRLAPSNTGVEKVRGVYSAFKENKEPIEGSNGEKE